MLQNYNESISVIALPYNKFVLFWNMSFHYTIKHQKKGHITSAIIVHKIFVLT